MYVIDCGATLTSSFGTIKSPGFPQNYANNVNCNWLIQLPSGNTVEFSFISLDIEPCGATCLYVIIFSIGTFGN